MQLLARTRFFGQGHPLSGLDPVALGAVYRNRAEFKAPAAAEGRGASARAARSRGEAVKRQTIAERKQAELAASGRGTSATEGKDD
jgi:preprotein translocase subunit SecD